MSNQDQIAFAVTEIARTMQAATKVLEALLPAATISLPHAAPTRPKRDRNSASTEPPVRWSKTGSNWPHIGGRRFKQAPPDVFLSKEYLARYRPGRWRDCYVANCTGLNQLSARFSVPIAKVSTCDDGALCDRLKEIESEQYGSLCLLKEAEVQQEGFKRWSTFRPPSSLTPSPNSPVKIDKECLRVCMPDGMTNDDFDGGFDELVGLGSVADWLESDAGQIHCEKVGAEGNYARRYTRRRYDRGSRLEQAKEIVVFRSRSDFDRLVAIAERVISEYLGLHEG